MSSRVGPLVRVVALAAVACVSATGPLGAQDSRTVELVKELTDRLGQAKLESIAAKGGEADQFVAALWIPGFQLLVVSAQYSAPEIMAAKIGKKEYRDVYLDLNSASIPKSRLFVEDMAADGVKARGGRNEAFDTYESASGRVAFDGDYRAQKISEDEYMKAFAAADNAYSSILTLLLNELKKGS